MSTHDGAKEVRIHDGQTDHASGRPLSISHEHARVHDGTCFVASHIFPSVVVGGSVNARVKTGAKDCHALLGFGSAGPVSVSIYENSTFSAPGTVVPSANRNRGSSNTPTVSVYHTATVSNNGNIVLESSFNDGADNLSAGGYGFEWILKKNTEHYVSLVNVDGKDIAMGFTINWYEV